MHLCDSPVTKFLHVAVRWDCGTRDSSLTRKLKPRETLAGEGANRSPLITSQTPCKPFAGATEDPSSMIIENFIGPKRSIIGSVSCPSKDKLVEIPNYVMQDTFNFGRFHFHGPVLLQMFLSFS